MKVRFVPRMERRVTITHMAQGTVFQEGSFYFLKIRQKDGEYNAVRLHDGALMYFKAELGIVMDAELAVSPDHG